MTVLVLFCFGCCSFLFHIFVVLVIFIALGQSVLQSAMYFVMHKNGKQGWGCDYISKSQGGKFFSPALRLLNKNPSNDCVCSVRSSSSTMYSVPIIIISYQLLLRTHEEIARIKFDLACHL